MGIQKIVLETDSIGAAPKLMKEGQNRPFYSPLVAKIKSLLGSFDDFSVRAVWRSVNAVAHRLAKEGRENKLCKIWLGVPPACIANCLVLDVSVI
jgi:hypothetical protein